MTPHGEPAQRWATSSRPRSAARSMPASDSAGMPAQAASTRAAKPAAGRNYIDRIGAEMNRLPAACRQATGKAMSALHAVWPAK